MSQEININFSYSNEEKECKKFNYLIIQYNENSEEQELKLNLEEESLNELDKINDFILISIMNQKKINFILMNEENTPDVEKEIINSIIEVYQKEYSEIINEINNSGLLEKKE